MISAGKFFDGHNDLLLRLWVNHADNPASAFFAGREQGHLDFPRMRQGGFAGGLFAVFVPPVAWLAGERGQEVARVQAQHDALAIAEAQIAILHQLAQASAGRARLCLTATEIEQCLQQDVLALVMHIEGAEMLDEELTLLDRFYHLGLRSIGPFWNLPNRFGVGVSGGFPGSPDTGDGMTAAGKALIRACNQRRLLIDLSHMNEKTFWQTAELSDAPLVATHSNAHALCAQPRNLTNAQLEAIAASDGFVGVNFGNAFLRADGQRNADTSLNEIVNHLCFLLDKLGEDRVGFGSDFDGISVPESLGDVAGMPSLFNALTAAGIDADLQEKLAWRNWLRVLKRTWGQ
ncbi:peptidase [Mixta theicola]|uniref:Peptidase n=1 Tax=Mixta theicola TaxID=1458355 RepID=A0A2K1Q9R8_9GAMM|nr:dipeptidase [Mixta theicola]PNS11779.1 peptidase [Mixta theicola]GLR07695.1 dipeptidase [Mixta theicola]